MPEEGSTGATPVRKNLPTGLDTKEIQEYEEADKQTDEKVADMLTNKRAAKRRKSKDVINREQGAIIKQVEASKL